jgi:hypothetical protein
MKMAIFRLKLILIEKINDHNIGPSLKALLSQCAPKYRFNTINAYSGLDSDVALAQNLELFTRNDDSFIGINERH